MLNNTQTHNHTVYSYLQALLTVTKFQHCAASPLSPFTQHCMSRDTHSHMINHSDVYRSNKFTIYGRYSKGTAVVVCIMELSLHQRNKEPCTGVVIIL